jgi:hypothetical protein
MTTMSAWSLIGPRESASVARGMPQEHKAIVMIAREGGSIVGGTPREHEAILNRESQGNTQSQASP